MTMTIYDDINPDFDVPVDDQWEPWMDEEAPEVHPGGCHYCGEPDVRDVPEPFGGKPCCDRCFNLLIGGEEGDSPWRCGTDVGLG